MVIWAIADEAAVKKQQRQAIPNCALPSFLATKLWDKIKQSLLYITNF